MGGGRPVTGTDVDVDGGLVIEAFVLAEREAGVGTVIHPVEPEADVIFGAGDAG